MATTPLKTPERCVLLRGGRRGGSGCRQVSDNEGCVEFEWGFPLVRGSLGSSSSVDYSNSYWGLRVGVGGWEGSILRPLNSPTSYRHTLCFSGSCGRGREPWTVNLRSVDNNNFWMFALRGGGGGGGGGRRVEGGGWRRCCCCWPCGRAWRTADSRSSGSCSRSPNGGTRPSPGWTSHRTGSSAHSPRSWGETRRTRRRRRRRRWSRRC